MEETRFSETSVSYHITIRCHNPEDQQIEKGEMGGHVTRMEKMRNENELLVETYEVVFKSFRTESITKYTLTTINTR